MKHFSLFSFVTLLYSFATVGSLAEGVAALPVYQYVWKGNDISFQSMRCGIINSTTNWICYPERIEPVLPPREELVWVETGGGFGNLISVDTGKRLFPEGALRSHWKDQSILPFVSNGMFSAFSSIGAPLLVAIDKKTITNHERPTALSPVRQHILACDDEIGFSEVPYLCEFYPFSEKQPIQRCSFFGPVFKPMTNGKYLPGLPRLCLLHTNGLQFLENSVEIPRSANRDCHPSLWINGYRWVDVHPDILENAPRSGMFLSNAGTVLGTNLLYSPGNWDFLPYFSSNRQAIVMLQSGKPAVLYPDGTTDENEELIPASRDNQDCFSFSRRFHSELNSIPDDKDSASRSLVSSLETRDFPTTNYISVLPEYVFVPLEQGSRPIITNDNSLPDTINRLAETHLIFRHIPAGETLLGDISCRFRGKIGFEEPHRVVFQTGFYLQVFEFTRGNLARVQERYAVDAHASLLPAQIPTFFPNGLNALMTDIENKTGLKTRIPTESEWEYACRSGSHSDLFIGENLEGYFISSNLNLIARYAFNQEPGTGSCLYRACLSGLSDVGTLVPNAFGLFDMLGNVSELVIPEQEEIAIFMSRPVLETKSDCFQFRGGGCWDSAWMCTAHEKQFLFASEITQQNGFRLFAGEAEMRQYLMDCNER